jgi:hypothetical protein
MTLDDRRVALDRAWDALVRGEAPEPSGPADAPLTAIAARLQATSEIPTLVPDPEASWRELRARATGLPETAWPAPPVAGANGHRDELPASRGTPPRSQSARRWWFSQLATAALLLVAAAAAFLVLSQGVVRERETPTWLPDSAVTSLPGYAEEVLFEATFAADELPHSPAAALFYQLTLPPGASLPNLAAMNCVRSHGCNTDAVDMGVGIELVEAGAYGIRLEGPTWVQSAGASSGNLEIAAGQDAVLRPGDAAIFHDYTAAGEIRNAASEPVEIIGVAIVDQGTSGEPVSDLPPEVVGEQLDISLTTDWDALPAGPVTVALRRVTLPPRTLLPPFEPRGLESIRVEHGSIAWTFAHSAEAADGGLRIHRRAGETAPFAISPGGAMRFLESTGEEPAELLVLTIEAAGGTGNLLSP